MGAMEIFCALAVVWIIFCCMIRRGQKKKEREESLRELEKTTSTYQLSCPYCDHVAYSRVKWGEKPVTYTCTNCRRSFTQEERENLLENDRELADAYFQGLTLKEAILEKVKKGGDGHVTFREDGAVTWYNGLHVAADPIGQLYGLETRQGRLKIAQLCMNYCRTRAPEYNYWLMDSGFAWERIYKEYVPKYR